MINDQSQNQKNGIVTSCAEHYFKACFQRKKNHIPKKNPYQAQKTDLGFLHTNPKISDKSRFLHGNQNSISDDLLE